MPEQSWIGAPDASTAPLFRKRFACEKKPTKATLLISGLGCHEAWMNGTRVGDHLLDPAQTDYELRVFYVCHDVTELLQVGDNVLGVILGNGWYNQDKVWGPNGLSYGKPRLMAELHLSFVDDCAEVIRADESWLWHPGPITDDNLYAGESYDARLEIEGWCEPCADESKWANAVLMEQPGGRLLEQAMPPMRQIEELTPVAINKHGDNFVADFGQNFSGWARIRVNAPAGREIVMRYAETVFPDGTLDTATTGVFATKVEQVDRYVCKGGGVEVWEPRFTYHGFRYVEVAGWPGELTADAITGVVVHNDLPTAGGFECSDERLNRLHAMALWTHRSNCHGIPEDCPAREKCGWLGDANLVAEYSLWNYDGKAFWEKYLGDVETTRSFNDGVPANIAPGKRCTRSKANPDWAAAFIMVPWYLYQFSGDRSVLERHWEGMTRLMAHFETIAEDWVLTAGYGDFFDPGADAIVQHTPIPLTSTLWFYRCADVMVTMAEAMGESELAQTYRGWCARIAAALKESFFDDAAGSFGSQGGNVLALAFDVLPDETERLVAALVKDIEMRDGHMNVGVMGVRYVLEVLTNNGHGELALALMHQNSYPSFGHLIERGATTLWEYWGEEGIDGTHGPRSLSHPFMGGYDNWFFNTLAGIRHDPHSPGFEHFYLEPHIVNGLDWVRCHHDSPLGRIESNWQMENGELAWDVVIPEDATATVTLPNGEVIGLGPGTHRYDIVSATTT